MSQNKPTGLSQVACITVTFNPDMSLLSAQLATLPPDAPKVVIDNASTADLVREIEALMGTVPNARLLLNPNNMGLAAAVNAGVKFAKANWSDARFALLLDQDSEPRPGSIGGLVEAFDALQARGERVGCVGPILIDVSTGLQHGFHQCARWRWRRAYPPPGSITPVPCANLNGSGTLVQIELFLGLGGLDETLFIDHVDTEWAFRVLDAGYSLWGIPDAMFRHSMGERSRRFWLFGWRVWPVRSASRHYFLFRNAVILMRRRYVPMVWKAWVTIKLILTFWVTLIIGPERRKQVSSMLRGVRAGLAFGNVNHG